MGLYWERERERKREFSSLNEGKTFGEKWGACDF